jgi:hypothetical protein
MQGIKPSGGSTLRPEQAEDLPDGFKGMVAATDGYVDALLMNFQGALLRMAIFHAWLPYVIPFIGAALCDGLIVRGIKRKTLRMLNPALYSLGAHLAVVLILSPAAVFLSPVPYAAWLVPLWAIGSAGAALLVAGNAARMG